MGKKILLAVVIIIAIPLIIAMFSKDEMTIERTVVINKPDQDVFNYVKMLKNQANFSKWEKMDPNAKMEYTGTDGTVGATSSWDSQNKDVGKGTQTIAKIDEGKRIDVDLHFIKPWENNCNGYFTTEAVSPTQTKVTWGFHSKLNYMMKVMHLFMNMDKMVGGDLQTGLDNLKGVLEK